MRPFLLRIYREKTAFLTNIFCCWIHNVDAYKSLMHIIAKADFWVFLLDKEKSRTKVAYCKKVGVFLFICRSFGSELKLGQNFFIVVEMFVTDKIESEF